MVPVNESNTTTDAMTSLLDEIRTSSILTERQVEKIEAYTAEEGFPTERAEIAARLVKDGVLTQYQARHDLEG